ncbi:MFS transporter [Brevibacillus gelatini]
MREISGKTQVVAVALVTALCMLGDSMLYVVLPLYWREAGLGSLWEVGVLLSVNRFIRVPLGPLVGKWYERTGGRTGLVLAVVLAFVTTLSYGFQGFWLWLVMRSLWGVAWTFLRLGAYSLIVSVADGHNRGQMMGLYNGLYRLGSLGGNARRSAVRLLVRLAAGFASARLLLAVCAVARLFLHSSWLFLPDRVSCRGRRGAAQAGAVAAGGHAKNHADRAFRHHGLSRHVCFHAEQAGRAAGPVSRARRHRAGSCRARKRSARTALVLGAVGRACSRQAGGSVRQKEDVCRDAFYRLSPVRAQSGGGAAWRVVCGALRHSVDRDDSYDSDGHARGR